VNKTTPYEDLIAAKLDQIAVPDMSDSIWANIEMQLDEVPDTPGKKSSGGNAGNAWYGIISLIVVVTLCWWFYNKKKPLPQQQVIPPARVIIPPKDSLVIIEEIIQKRILKVVQKDTVKAMSLPEEKGNENEKEEEKIIADSPAVRRPVVDTITVVHPPVKKRKGVKGITGDDYRLSVQKGDSTHP
jgi:hypothetical protein